MIGWRVDPAQVRKILTRAETEQQALQAVTSRVEAQPAKPSVPGGTAIEEFFGARLPGARWIDARVSDVVDGTDQALAAYEAGDLDMAAEQQSAASRISDTGAF
jgi:hypothetical protein